MERSEALRKFLERLEDEYARRFPRSKAHHERGEAGLLDCTSHAMRSNRPFMPIARKAEGAVVEDLDGNRCLDYWQGHFVNILGHNPPLIREALVESLGEGRGLQTGMLHEIEAEVAERICRSTGSETARLTTSGTLGTFFAVVLSRAFTGRDRVLKVSGGWHGSQPFGLKGVAPQGSSFDHLESEGLSASTSAEIVLTRFNDVEDLRDVFDRTGDAIACFLLEPVLGAGGGAVASLDYLREARRLTAKHGALLLCDEIITAFRFRAGDLTSVYGVRPDLLILGKVLGGGMPVAAVVGRRDVMSLSSRRSGRVKFEGGTFSAHELSLVATRTMLEHLERHGEEIYPRLAEAGERMRRELGEAAERAGVPVHVLGALGDGMPGSSLVLVHAAGVEAPSPTCPEELAERAHPRIDERLLKSVLMLEGLSTRSGLGAISTAHTAEDLDRTSERFEAGLRRFKKAGVA